MHNVKLMLRRALSNLLARCDVIRRGLDKRRISADQDWAAGVMLSVESAGSSL